MNREVNKFGINEKKSVKILFKILCVFLIIQPFFDILSNLYNYGYYSINFITYLKPFIVFGIFGYLFLFIKFKGKLKYFLYYLLLAIFLALHSYVLYFIFVDTATIIHELRFCINIIYFITLFFTFKILYNLFDDKKEFFNKLKNTFYITISIYVIAYLLAVITNTSWLTYEFADASKLGYRGWYYSGQIFGHFLSIAAPLFILKTFEGKISLFWKIIILTVFIIPFLMIGTKVPYFIIVIVFALFIIINFIYKLINKNYKIKWLNLLIALIFVIVSIISYKYVPVYTNMQINGSVSGTEYKEEDIKEHQEKNQIKLKEVEEKVKESKEKAELENIKPSKKDKEDEERLIVAKEYDLWTTKSLDVLNVLYATNKIHSSHNRDRQLYFMAYKFEYSTTPFKLVGLGYLNQPNALSMERDIAMPLFSFGIIGFILFTGPLWVLLFKIIIFAISNIKKLDLELIVLAEGFCMFFCISYFAGYTYIYTQFANILAIIMILLFAKMNLIKKEKTIIKALNNITTDDYNQVMNKLEKNMKKNKKTFVITANPETLMLSKKDTEINDMLFNDEILKVPDGIAVVKACQRNDINVTGRITGCDLSVSLLKVADEEKKTLYLFGAKKVVLKSLLKVLKKDYPNIKVLKAQDGYVKDREKIKKEIIKLQPDLCLVALGIPHQEKFINDIYQEVDKGIFMGVGGTFDVLSGTKKRAPKIFIKLNLEWLYRILCEPFRIKRFIKSNFKFIFEVFM